MNRPLIIGQAPARGNDGLPPFAGESGARLARLAGVGDSGDALPDHFDLVNLNEKYPGKSKFKGDKFDMIEGRRRAAGIKRNIQDDLRGRFVFLMGRKVEKCFGWGQHDFLRIYVWHQSDIIIFPHPSGVNMWWNEPDHVDAARAVLGLALRASR